MLPGVVSPSELYNMRVHEQGVVDNLSPDILLIAHNLSPLNKLYSYLNKKAQRSTTCVNQDMFGHCTCGEATGMCNRHNHATNIEDTNRKLPPARQS